MIFIYLMFFCRAEGTLWRRSTRPQISASVSSQSKVKFSKILRPRENAILEKPQNILSVAVASETSCNDSVSDTFRHLQAAQRTVARNEDTRSSTALIESSCCSTANPGVFQRSKCAEFASFGGWCERTLNCAPPRIARRAAVENPPTGD